MSFLSVPPSPVRDTSKYVDLITISFKKVLDRESSEAPGGDAFEDVETLYALANKFFNLPLEEKTEYFYANDERGYKYEDDVQTFEVRRDESTAQRTFPSTRLGHEEGLAPRFIAVSHHITKEVLDRLASALSLTARSQLLAAHDDLITSDSGLKFESLPKKERLEDIPPSEHTDRGSLTLLFCEDFTTELRAPETRGWKFIMPKEGCAIVNVGDALQTLTEGEGMLVSCLHRVGQPLAGAGERVCVLYYLSPNNG